MCSAGDGRATAGDDGPPAARHTAGAPLPARHLRDQVRAAGGVPHQGHTVPRGMPVCQGRGYWGAWTTIKCEATRCFVF